MKHDEETRRGVAQRMAMAYLIHSIGNGYLEEALDMLKSAGLYMHSLKHYGESAVRAFDLFHNEMKKLFISPESDEVGRQIIEDYEVLKDVCDRFMGAGVRVSAQEDWNDENLRREGVYVCEVEGIGDLTLALMKWENRQWQQQAIGNGMAGWVRAMPEVRVTKVVMRMKEDEEGGEQ